MLIYLRLGVLHVTDRIQLWKIIIVIVIVVVIIIILTAIIIVNIIKNQAQAVGGSAGDEERSLYGRASGIGSE